VIAEDLAVDIAQARLSHRAAHRAAVATTTRALAAPLTALGAVAADSTDRRTYAFRVQEAPGGARREATTLAHVDHAGFADPRPRHAETLRPTSKV